MKEYILGIDPGLKGGLCLMEIGTRKIQTMSFIADDLPTHNSDKMKLWAIQGWDENIKQVGLENPPLFVPGGGNNGSTSAKLRESYGFWRGVLTHSHFSGSEIHLLPPQQWQKMYDVPKGKEHKRALAHAAMNLYPELEKMKTVSELQAVCDAVLICHFLHTHLY